MIIYGHEDKCIYCLIDEVQKEINKITIGRDDYFSRYRRWNSDIQKLIQPTKLL